MSERAAELLRSAAEVVSAENEELRAALATLSARVDRLERGGGAVPALLGPKAMAERMGVGRSTLRRMVDRGALPAPRAVPGLERPRFLSTDVPAHLTSLPAAPLPGPRKKHGRRS